MTDEELRERLAWGRQKLEEMGVFQSPEGLRQARGAKPCTTVRCSPATRG
jgi:hypothetical protein